MNALPHVLSPPKKIALPIGNLDSRVIDHFLGTPDPLLQTVSGLVQLFLQGSRYARS